MQATFCLLLITFSLIYDFIFDVLLMLMTNRQTKRLAFFHVSHRESLAMLLLARMLILSLGEKENQDLQ